MLWAIALLLRFVLTAVAIVCSCFPAANTLVSAGFAFVSLMLFGFSLWRLQFAVP